MLSEIAERRLVPICAAYLVTGFVALEAIDQLISRAFVPDVAYPVVLVLYLFGIPSSLIFAWFHGAPREEHIPRVHVLLQSGLAVAAIASGVYVYRSQPAALVAAEANRLPPTSVAVLYFADVSPGGDLGHVADGITEALIDQLDEVPSLDVVSRNGVLPFRGGALPLDSVAGVLRVGTLIEGAVGRRGNELRISTRLVDGFTGADIERVLVDIPAGEFLAARDSVSRNVAGLLRRRLGEDVHLRELRSGTDSDEAWALVHRAQGLSASRYSEADSLLALAEAIDPDWPRVAGARARAAYDRAWSIAASGDDLESSHGLIDAGIEHANRALALDSRDAFALEQRGTLRMLELQVATMLGENDGLALEGLLAEARTDLEAAVASDPSRATALGMLSFLVAGLGDNVGAILYAQRALEEDAYVEGALTLYDRLFLAHYQEGRFEDARRWCDDGRARFPKAWQGVECQLLMLTTPDENPDVKAAWALWEELSAVYPVSLRLRRQGVASIMVAGVLMRAGMADSANAVFSRVDRSEEIDPQSTLLMWEARVRAGVGDAEGGLEALRQWVAATRGGLSPDDWWWRELQADPRFRQLVGTGR